MIPAQNSKVVLLTPPAAVINNSDVTVAELDTKGWDYCRIMVILGATDIALTACAVTESDTSGSGHSNVTGLVYGTSDNIAGETSSLPSATDDDSVFLFEIDLRRRKRYLDMDLTVGNGTSGACVTVLAELSRGEPLPDTATAAGAAEILRV